MVEKRRKNKKRMRKIVRTIVGIMGLVGFFIILGTVGASDYAIEVGEHFPTSVMIKQSVTGLLLMIPSCLFFGNWEVRANANSDETQGR